MTRSKEQINPTLRLLVGSKKQLDEEAVNQNAGLTNRKCIRGRGVLGQGWFFLPQLGPNLINMLNEKGVPTIGFTSFAMDESDIVKSIPDWRSRHLQELGINFNMEKEIVFQIQNGFVPPSFEKGTLYCGNFYKKDKDNKGKILCLYLDWLDWNPEQVVFIDDGKHHIESVKKELEKRGISFLGFLYIPKDLNSIDEKVAALQYETIINQKKWLSDEEAKKILSAEYPIISDLQY